MSAVLFLPHRLPFPPDKGDKVRSFHLLEALRKRHELYVATFVDSPEDLGHVGALRALCADSYVANINPTLRKLAAARAFLTGGSLTNAFYAHRGLRDWVAHVVRERQPVAIVVFSGAMAQFIPVATPAAQRVIDFCDIDSDKWRQYAELRRWPMRSVYRREAVALEREEIEIANGAGASLFVSDREAASFRRLAPGAAARVFAIRNGVDAFFFAPGASPKAAIMGVGPRVVFTGAMDYWANVEGVCWFAERIWPLIRARVGNAELAIVGMRPAPQVRALAQLPGIMVTGSVPDVRPYLAGAHVAVAPLRIARGVQNKVLEAMAMELPVVTTPLAAQGLDVPPPADVELKEDPAEFAAAVVARLMPASASRAPANRAYVLEHYDWSTNLRRFTDIVDRGSPPGAG